MIRKLMIATIPMGSSFTSLNDFVKMMMKISMMKSPLWDPLKLLKKYVHINKCNQYNVKNDCDRNEREAKEVGPCY